MAAITGSEVTTQQLRDRAFPIYHCPDPSNDGCTLTFRDTGELGVHLTGTPHFTQPGTVIVTEVQIAVRVFAAIREQVRR